MGSAWDNFVIPTSGGGGGSPPTTDAGDLISGTLPDARFPAILPAVDGSQLTNLPTGGTTNTVHVDDHGALGDGTTDDSTAIAAAIAAISTGGTVLFGPKVYAIGSPIVSTSGITLKGHDTTIRRLNDIIAMTFSSKMNFVVEGFIIDNLSNYSEDCIDVDGSTLFKLSDLIFPDLEKYGTGLNITSSTFFAIDNIKSNGGGSSAIELGNCSDVSGSNLLLDGSSEVGLIGLTLISCQRILIDKIIVKGFTDVDSSGTGLSISSCTQCLLRGQTISNLTGLTATGTCTDSIYEFVSTTDTAATAITSTDDRYIDLLTPDNLTTNAVHVDDYGAVGDGSTDDTAAFNAAITALPNGGTVLCGPKTYGINSSIYLLAGVSIEGDNTTLKALSDIHFFLLYGQQRISNLIINLAATPSGGKNVFFVNGVSDVIFSNITIMSDTHDVNGSSAFNISSGSKITFEKIKVTKLTFGLYINSGSSKIVGHDLFFDTCSGGIAIFSSCSDIQFSGILGLSCTGTAIDISDTTNVLVKGITKSCGSAYSESTANTRARIELLESGNTYPPTFVAGSSTVYVEMESLPTKVILPPSGDYTLTQLDNGRTISNYGSAAIHTYTLPVVGTGLSFKVKIRREEAYNVIIDGNSSNIWNGTTVIGATLTLTANGEVVLDWDYTAGKWFVESQSTGILPPLDASALLNIPASALTGSLPAIDGSSLTGISTVGYAPGDSSKWAGDPSSVSEALNRIAAVVGAAIAIP